MKKTAILLLAVLLIFSLGSVAASADGTVYSEGYFYYTLADQSITIVGYFGPEGEVTVPASIAGYPVNAIAAGAFAGKNMTAIHLPDTVRTVEEGATGEADVTFESQNGQNEPVQDPTAATGTGTGQTPTGNTGTGTGQTPPTGTGSSASQTPPTGTGSSASQTPPTGTGTGASTGNAASGGQESAAQSGAASTADSASNDKQNEEIYVAAPSIEEADPEPTPEPTEEPSPTPEAAEEPSPTPEPTEEPSPEPTEEPTPEPAQQGSAIGWIVGGAVLVIAAAAVLLRKKGGKA